MLKKIFAGEEIDAYLSNETSESRHCIIYFDHLGDRMSKLIRITNSEERAANPLKAFEHLGHKLLIIIALRGHWYQNSETEQFLRRFYDQNRKCCFVNIGYSMGGFAAVNFSYITKSRVLAFQPQAVLDPAVPMLPDFKECLENLIKNFESKILDFICCETEGFIFYDNIHIVDSWHANKILLNTKLEGIEIPYGGHSVSSVINSQYKIYKILSDFIHGQFSRHTFYQKFNIEATDSFIANNIKSNIESIRTNGYLTHKDLRRKIKIFTEADAPFLALETILKLKNINVEFFDYDTIKSIIKLLLKNRNFYDLNVFLNKMIETLKSSSESMYCLLYTGLGISYHCTSDIELCNLFMLRAIRYKTSDYFVLWHLNKFLGQNANVKMYIERYAIKKQKQNLQLINNCK